MTDVTPANNKLQKQGYLSKLASVFTPIPHEQRGDILGPIIGVALILAFLLSGILSGGMIPAGASLGLIVLTIVVKFAYCLAILKCCANCCRYSGRFFDAILTLKNNDHIEHPAQVFLAIMVPLASIAFAVTLMFVPGLREALAAVDILCQGMIETISQSLFTLPLVIMGSIAFWSSHTEKYIRFGNACAALYKSFKNVFKTDANSNDQTLNCEKEIGVKMKSSTQTQTSSYSTMLTNFFNKITPRFANQSTTEATSVVSKPLEINKVVVSENGYFSAGNRPVTYSDSTPTASSLPTLAPSPTLVTAIS